MQHRIGYVPQCTDIISYAHLKDEADPHPVAVRLGAPIMYTVPARKDINPQIVAQELGSACEACDAVSLLIPGRVFDRNGGRVGRGGGWYDRLLASVPPKWVRIGVCAPEQLADERIVQAPWDQAMDWICVVHPHTKQTTFLETCARS